MEIHSLRYPAFLLFGLLVAGCATSTPIVSEWRNPAYASASFSRIMIGALGGTTSARRNFEDEFSTQLRAAGVEGIASYGYLFEGADTDETTIRAAAQKAGVDAAIMARLVRVEEKTEYGGSYFPPASWIGIFGSHGGVSVSGPGGLSSPYRYNEYTTETTLLDVVKNEVVWTATTVAREPVSGRNAAKSTVDAVVKSLAETNLLRRRQ